MQSRRILASFARMFLLLGALTLSAFVSADDMNCGWNCCPQPCCDQAPTCDWGYNPPAHQKCGSCNPCGGFIDNLSGRVDFLWWRPYSEGLQLGTTEDFSVSETGGGGGGGGGAGAQSSTATSFALVNDHASTKQPNFKFDPGFRIGLGYYCPSNCWDIALNWTHFHSKAKAFGASEPITLSTFASESESFDLFFNDWSRLVGTFPDEVQSRWSLDMDLVDLEFAQKFYVNHCFILRPHFGLRFARVDQNNHVEAFSNHKAPFDDDDSYTSFTSVVKAKNDFRGVGPRIGLDMEIAWVAASSCMEKVQLPYCSEHLIATAVKRLLLQVQVWMMAKLMPLSLIWNTQPVETAVTQSLRQM